MASDKRNFTDFTSFPGEIKDGTYCFHPLYGTNSTGNPMMWKAYVRLVDHTDDHKVNWDPNTMPYVPIQPPNLEYNPHYTRMGLVDIPPHTIAMTWAHSGRVGGGTINIPTYITTGKNISRANRTNVLTQALIDMRSKYLKKIDNGYHPHGPGVPGGPPENGPLGGGPLYMPAFHKWIDKPINKERHITFPAAASIKYDGARVQTHFKSNKIYFSSRRLKLYPSKPHLEQELIPLFTEYDGLYLDAEAYMDDSNLNIITGAMTKESDNQNLYLNVFDVFQPRGECKINGIVLNATSSFSDRLIAMKYIFQHHLKGAKYIKMVNHVIVADQKEYDDFHNQVMTGDNEGTIIRNMNAPYEFSERREIRSYQIRKRKPRYDDKFTVVDYTEGKSGGCKGAIILQLETNNKKHKFYADPENITIANRIEIYKSMTKDKFNKYWKGKKMTVTYHALSDDGIPLQPKVSFGGFTWDGVKY